MILQSSPWECKPERLHSFMQTIAVDGGMGREAIEIGIGHVNQEAANNTVSQVILIREAPANTVDEVKQKRGSPFGVNYRKKQSFLIQLITQKN